MSFIDTDDDAFSVAARRIANSVRRPNADLQLPVQSQPQPTTYIIEPDLMETQTGNMHLPQDVAFDDVGNPYNTITGKPVKVVRRPNVLPIAKTPEGFTFAMPKMLDVASNIMGGIGAPAVATKAGEVVLGSGVVKTAQDAAKFKLTPVEGNPFAMDEASRMARANEQGYTTDVYHGTHAQDLTEFNPDMVDIGVHVGTPEQATSRLQHTANPFGRTYGHYSYREGANVLPLKAKLGKSLELPDVGLWNDSSAVAAALDKKGMGISGFHEEALDLKNSFGDTEDFLKSPENRQMLDELRDHIKSKGYNSVKYKNEVENSYGHLTDKKKDVQQYQTYLQDKVNKIEQAARDRMPQPPDVGHPNADEQLRKFLDAKLEDHLTPDEVKQIAAIHDESKALSANPDSYVDPHSYILLDTNQARSKFAQFDPAKSDSANLLYSDTRNQVYAQAGHQLEKQNQPFYSALERTNDKFITNALNEYNKNLPSIKDQYYDWAGKDYSYNIFNKDDIKNIYGEDIPENIKNILNENDEVVKISSPHNVEYFSKKDAPSLDAHMKEIVSNQGGMFEASDLDDIMKGLALKVKGGEEAASAAFKSLAKEKGWKISNGVRYFNINKGDKSYDIRISNHPNLTRSNPNAVTPDINIAPGAHDFNDAMTLLSDTRPQVTNAIGHAVEKQTGPFYSALERTVDNAKINKASPEQWLGYLKNQPGVKSEELGYVLNNLPEGQISKEALGDIIKNNKIELKEKVLGSDTKHIDVKLDELQPLVNKMIQENDKLGFDSIGQARSAIRTYNPADWEFNNSKDLALAIEYHKLFQSKLDQIPTKYHDYQLPGGENYQEMLLTLPDKHGEYIKNIDKQFDEVNTELRILANKGEQNSKEYLDLSKQYKDLYFARKAAYEKTGTAFQSSHWDEPNILAHVRYNDRNIPDVGKSLHLEEIQSDWHQAGRKQGYVSNKPLSQDELQELGGLKGASMGRELTPVEDARYSELLARNGEKSGLVPDAPFKKNWDELAFKRMLHKAAAEGYDSVSWTPGEAQAARYDLSKHLDSVGYQKRGENTYNITAWGKNGGSVWSNQSATPEMIEQHLGKEMADKIIKGTGRKEGNHTYLEDLDLKVGGEGMKSFYDKMLVDKANALAKKYGAKVETNKPLGYTLVNKHGIESKGGKTLEEAEKQLKYKIEAVGDKNDWKIVPEKPVHVLKLTPELRAKAKSGFPLFSSTPITTPVDYDPFQTNKKYRLVPIQGNPFNE